MGRPAFDLTGQRFGRWLVIERDFSVPKKRPHWKCLCDCGNTKTVSSKSLLKSSSQSCGCLARELISKRRFKDRTGERYGYLVVMECIGETHYRAYRWLCQCDCGNTTVVLGPNLRNGDTKSCGCITKELQSKSLTKDELGNRYGFLTVIDRLEIRSKNMYWLCECDCGAISEVRGSHLRSGTVKSCGCKLQELRIPKITTHGKTYTKEYQNYVQRMRKKAERKLDSNWTPEMEFFLRNLFQECVLCHITNNEHNQLYNQNLHVDHVRPLSRGHGLQPGNAVMLCRDCNNKKHNTALEDLSEQTRHILVQSADLFKLLWNNKYETTF